MNCKNAQKYINSLPLYRQPSKKDLERISHLKVDYSSLEDMPKYIKEKILFAVDYIVEKYNPQFIDLVMSYVNGYPVDENTSQKDFELKKEILGKSKLSDFDFIVPTIDRFQHIEQISPLIKIDLFKFHHNGVKRLRVYKKEENVG